MSYSVGVIPRKTFSVYRITEEGALLGRNTKTGRDVQVDILQSFPLEKALERSWEFDAHAIPYFIQTPVGDTVHFRLAQNSEAMFSLENSGYQILTQLIFLDYDNPEHKEWESREEADAWLHEFLLLFQDEPQALPYCIYTTRAGARLVYRLTEPYPVRKIGGYVRALLDEYQQLGVEFDESCDQWTRIYFLPRVERGGKATGEQDYFILRQWDTYLDLSDVDPIGDSKEKIAYESTGHRPRPLGIEEYLYQQNANELRGEKGGRRKQTSWYTMAKRVLKNRDPHLANTLLNNGKMPPKSKRNNWLAENIGRLVRMFRNREGSTPEHLFGLIYEAVDRLAPDAGTPDWHDCAWEMIQRFWELDTLRERADNEGLEEAKEEQVEWEEELLPLREREKQLLQAMQEKYPDCEGLFQSLDADSLDWIRERAILSHGARAFHLLDWDGTYDRQPVSGMGLVAKIRRTGMDEFLVVEDLTETKGLVPRGYQRVLSDYSVELREVQFSAHVTEATVVGLDEAAPTLVLPACLVNTRIKRKFDADVNEWLRECVDKQFWPYFERWIVAAMEVMGPLPLLSIIGGPGCGKSLLVRGLSECFEHSSHCDTQAFLGGWNSALLRNPIIYIDEGLASQGRKGEKAVSEEVRKWIGGSRVVVREKFQPEIMAEINPRIIATANNKRILETLVGPMQEKSDLEAIQARILHVPFRKAGADFLRAKGNRILTNKWVGPGSEHRLAGHLLYLWENSRHELHVERGRFLAPGYLPMETMFELTFGNDKAQEVVQALVGFIETDLEDAHTGRFLMISNEKRVGKIFIHSEGLRSWARSVSFEYGWNLTIRTIRGVLEVLGTFEGRRRLEWEGRESPNCNWYQINLREFAILAKKVSDSELKNLRKALVARWGEDEASLILRTDNPTKSIGREFGS